jgi:tetratricopeptide (TPR) repeat protein
VWVSSNPYQLGEFVCYDLNEIFSGKDLKESLQAKTTLNIARDPFLDSEEFNNYEISKMLETEVSAAINKKEDMALSDDFIPYYQSMNPDYWLVYYQAGRYYFGINEFSKAKTEFEKALTKEITTVPDRENVEKYLKRTLKKLK